MSLAEKLVTVAENVPKVYEAGQKSMVDKSKIIEKTANGIDVLSLDDVSEVPHKLKVSLESKNKIPYPFPYGNGTKTINGVTFTDNGDGTVTANGTATANAVYYLHHNMSSPLSFTKGVYTLSGTPEGGAWGRYRLALSRIIDGTQETGDQADDGNGKTVELEYVGAIYIIIYSGQTVENLVFKPQIEEGEATEFTKGIADFSSVKVSTLENLLPLQKIYQNRSRFTIFDDFSYYTNATYTKDFNSIAASEAFELEAGTYWWEFDVKLVGGTHKGVFARLYNPDTSSEFVIADFSVSELERYEHRKVSFTLTEKTRFLHRINSVETDGVTNYRDCYIKNLVIYKNKVDYQSNASGTVSGINSKSPCVVLMADTDGIELFVKYNKSYGIQTEYDRFWDYFQADGNRVDYQFSFCGGGWTPKMFAPKYKCTPTGSANYMFYRCGFGNGRWVIDFRKIADKFDFSKVTTASYMFYSVAMDFISADFSSVTNMSYAFAHYLSKLTTLTLKLTPTTTNASNAFLELGALKNLTFTDDSEIACNLDFNKCVALTHDSLMSIINALQDGVTSKTLTLGSANLAKLTDAEKAKATQKGWTLA